MTHKKRFDLSAADGRNVSFGSVFSTILLNHAIHLAAEQIGTDNGGGSASIGGPGSCYSVLDVGCGESPYRDLLSPTMYFGVDRKPRPRAGDAAAIGDVMAIPARDSCFDGVICTEVIEHVGNERDLVTELARVARPGAGLVLSSPFVHGLHEMPYDYRRLTSIGLATVLDEAGWSIDTMLSVGGPLVVAVDSFVRWGSQRTRAVANKVARSGSLANRMLLAPATIGQKLLAAVALRSPLTRLGSIDPYLGLPRLTLGYVVVATRKAS